ncbi:glycoside hydrolase family 127 protein [Microbacterium ulmi]|uniref:Non-reducing end beta-L-arabinofuranosidase-like GH127 catalytic domain-containing protein n=1 Tax=Microbacterium ulmi TaxID=179095 RepID=A0A7Y2PZV2_9MICO|nr:beta-L-arabinofuranosidase domain-containing protein [Microbacterium ulmi]NII69158.1 hypothetical protein [Microbacterium ulmi]NNH03698.1 hypothetical protein [Microbacterium ulmi]
MATMQHARRHDRWSLDLARPDALEPVIARIDPSTDLGARYDGTLQRLLDVDLEPLLDGFRVKPGAQPWIGEHIGKWLDAAALVVEATGDARLQAKLDLAVRELVATQEPDGYLGTYVPAQRFGWYPDAEWDAWVHKYCLIGLLSYHRVTGDPDALAAARRVGDLLVATFGGPDGRDIIPTGWHQGMASTSVIGPLVWLYRATGDGRYAGLVREIVDAWDRPGGPRVLSTLLDTGRVSEVGNGKAYEMLSNILGLAELALVDSDPRYLEAATRAWQDVVDHHLYLTGTASFGEHFHQPGELPDSASVHMGETCVTVTWLQLTRRLFLATGDARYADEVERTLLNHLSGAQTPDGSAWCYYSPLAGRRDYGSGISCCISSGPRGMALASDSVFARTPDGSELVVSLYQSADAEIELGGRPVHVALRTTLPDAHGATLAFDLDGEAEFAVRLRRPSWATGDIAAGGADDDGWIVVAPRRYSRGDELRIDIGAGIRVVSGDGWNAGRVALAWGPLVLSYVAEGEEPAVFDVLEQPPAAVSRHEALPWSVANALAPRGRRRAAVLPFARSGVSSATSRVWIAAAAPEIELSVFHGAEELRGSGDLAKGSIADYDPWSFASSEDDSPRRDAWFGLRSARPVTFRRVSFAHGRSMVHGGWFDASEGAPRIEALLTPDAEWTEIARIAAYPATDAAHDAGIAAGERFDVLLDEPVTAWGVRVAGTASFGDYPGPRRFATCALLCAYAD